jgi:hypothetical protein
MPHPNASQAARVTARTASRGALRRESVKKNVAAIHVSGKLSLLQRKLSNVLLLNAYDGLLSNRSHAVDARTLCVMIGYNSNDMDTLKEALRALVETTAEWDMLNDDGRHEWGVSALLASARLRGGVCEYAYSPALAEKLHDPKIFALINLSVQRNFNSGHALALYENCYRFVRTGSTGWWDLQLFRRLMGVDESEYYHVFKHLNAKVIKPAVAEVNAVSNIRLTAETERRGRGVSRIRFLIREVEPAPDTVAAAPESGEDGSSGAGRDLAVRLKGLGVSDRLARVWLAEHGEAYVAEKLDYVAERSRDGKVRGSAVGYLSAAIRDNYRAATTVARPQPQGRLPLGALEARRAETLRLEARDRIAALRKVHRSACFDVVEALANAREAMDGEQDRAAFLASLDSEADREDFRRRGWRSSLNSRAIFRFWRQMQPGALPLIEDIAAAQGQDWAALCDEAGGEDRATAP